MLNPAADRGAKRRYPSPNATDYNEIEPPRVPLFCMPLTQSRKLIRFPYIPMPSTTKITPRPTKRVKWNKEPAHWRTTSGDFVDGTVLQPSSSSDDDDDDTNRNPGLSNTSASSDGSNASSDIIMLDGSPCSSKAELARLPPKNKRPLSEPALYQTIDEAVARTLKRRLVPHLNKVEEIVQLNAAEALERMRERIRIAYQVDFERLEGQVRKAKRVCKEREREIERLVKEREGGYWGDAFGDDAVGENKGEEGLEGEKKGEEMAVERVRRLFVEFRAKVWEFVSSSALQLETKKAKVMEVDVMRLPWVPDQQLFGSASVEVRRFLVMAAVFQVLYSRILRPGHRTFGAELDEEVDERRETGRVERQLEEIEGYLMRHEKVGHKGEAKWRAVNINLFKQLRNGILTVEAKSAAQTLIGYLEPLMNFTFARNKQMVEKIIEQLCEQAVDLKLAIRKSPVPLRIDIASKSTDEEGDEDPPEWEPKVDKTGKPLIDPRWHEKMGQLKLTTEEKDVSTRVKYIAFIPFGALARCEPNGLKVAVERAWAIGRA
ncbi:hypothetical protein GE21DRAFT_5390 [Neurospora crassa]|uniref:Uncharacterized protein n=1 Tax=Neurospora crassa (strain ATCC 24698 / 74-OR23-1A / CBS 708.71 / DSM 1257 / FGSC 987) TaxID=367110 RepID=Q7S3T3_NEUCR|nr:hypothetical protein NCU04934 [Neurospora crassa OR74A]EAA30146.1 hypothetical protein NCU04934 [Neurospora crassa OR74A]KHE81606.1 hypothetical protein GE21DRAFT_5390 [Neurospora crassa]|eukprot:XP_959382.1 hypothetical protein NCU04934 [Neurospora crassa OR74A]